MYFILGASGSGKSTVISDLKRLLPNFEINDFDDIGVPEYPDKKWRQEATEAWANKYINTGLERRGCLVGQMVLGEILACPSVKKMTEIHVCFLDCSDLIRIERLKNRGAYGADQSTLNWASWLRVHHQDPSWMPHVIKENASPILDFSLWPEDLKSWKSLADVDLLDTSFMSVEEVSEYLKNWILQSQ